MTNEKAIELLKAQHCTGKCDDFMWFDETYEQCKKPIPLKVTKFIKNRTKDVLGVGGCPNCNTLVIETQKHCPNCGQRFDWGNESKEK